MVNNSADLTRFLSRADRLATAFDIERALADWDKTPQPEMELSIKQILYDQENLRAARELVQQLDAVKKMLLDKFGYALESELQNRVNTLAVSNSWELHRAGDEAWSKPWAGQRLMPKSERNPSLHVLIQQAYDKIFLGICRTYEKNKHPEWEVQEVKEFEATLMQKREYRRGGQWWLGYEHLYFLDEDKFFLEASGNMSILVTDMANKFMNLFFEYQEQLVRTNQALLQLG